MTKRQRKIWFLLSVLAFLIITPPVLLYTAGYRLSDDWHVTKTGGVYIYSPISGSEIFLNNDLKKITNILQSGIFVQNLRPRAYSAIVAKEGYLPWQKNLAVDSQLVTEVHAFLIPLSPQGKTILRGPISGIYGAPSGETLLLEEVKNRDKKLVFYRPRSAEFLSSVSTDTEEMLTSRNSISAIYWDGDTAYVIRGQKTIKVEMDMSANTVAASYSTAPQELAAASAELKLAPQYIKYDKRGSLRVWAEKNTVWAEWLRTGYPLPYYMQKEKALIFTAESTIKNLDFFPSRRDMIIFSDKNGIYALELDGRGGRNMQPIYKGKNPNFAIDPSQKIIYVLDDGALSEISLSL